MRFIIAHLMVDLGDDKGLVREIVPNIHDWIGGLRYPWNGAHAAKTHLLYEKIPSRRMKTRSAIYVVRNPLDVVDSALSYLSPESEQEKNRIVESFVTHGSVEPWNETLGYGSWQENVNSWTDNSHAFPVLTLRYEDLLAEPAENIARVAAFLEIDADKEKISYVCKETDFRTMKKTEKSEVTAGKKGVFTDERLFDKKEFSFMRKGSSGVHKDSLSTGQIEDLKTAFGEPFRRFQYR